MGARSWIAAAAAVVAVAVLVDGMVVGAAEPPRRSAGGAVEPPPRRASHITESSGRIVVAMPSLAYFADGREELLLRYLEASPEWRVGVFGRDADVTVAIKRSLKDGGRVEGNYRYKGGSVGPRLVFSEQPGEVPRDVLQGPIPPEAGEVTVPVWRATYLPRGSTVHGETWLWIGAPGLWLELWEARLDPTRPGTQWQIEEIERELAAVRAAVEGGEPGGALPADAYKSGPASLELNSSSAGGLRIRGWVNPGEPGWVVPRVFDVQTGKEIEASPIESERERVGWDAADPGRVFLFDGSAHLGLVRKGGGGKTVVRVELWFRPDAAAGEMRRLITGETEATHWIIRVEGETAGR